MVKCTPLQYVNHPPPLLSVYSSSHAAICSILHFNYLCGANRKMYTPAVRLPLPPSSLCILITPPLMLLFVHSSIFNFLFQLFCQVLQKKIICIKNMFNLDEEKIICTWQQSFGLLAGQESRECCDFYF